MHERLPSYDIVDHPADAPVFLFGPPKKLTGVVPLRNGGGERAVLRRAALRGDVAGGLAVRRLSSVRLEPDQRSDVELTFDIDPTTPPGEYEAEVEVAGVVRSAVVRVTEAVAVDVTPFRLVIEAAPGDTVEKHVVVQNKGNVDALVNAAAVIPLDDEVLDCRILRGALDRFTSREDATFDDLLVDMAEAGRHALDRAGLARVRTIEGMQTIAPGEARTVGFLIQVPPNLPFGSRYYGRLPVSSRFVRLVFVPHRATVDEDAVDEPATTAKKAGGSSKKRASGSRGRA
jgi:hypothetical protein